MHHNKLSARAAAGQTTTTELHVPKPDTVIVAPDGKELHLGRRAQSDYTLSFEKHNSKSRGKTNTARLKKLRDALPPPGQVPFVHALVAGYIIYRMGSFIMRKFFGKNDRELELADGEGEDDDEDELPPGYQHLPPGLLPTMLRASLPKPKRKGRAQRAAELHHSRPRSYKTAHSMMHPGTHPAAGASAGSKGANVAKQRPVGKLEKMDILARQQVRALLMAQQQQQRQQLALEASQGLPLCMLPQPAIGGAPPPPPRPTQPAAPAGPGALLPSSSASNTALATRQGQGQGTMQASSSSQPQQQQRFPGVPDKLLAPAQPSVPPLPHNASRPEVRALTQLQQQQQQQAAAASAAAGASSGAASPSTTSAAAAASPGAVAAGAAGQQQQQEQDVSAAEAVPEVPRIRRQPKAAK